MENKIYNYKGTEITFILQGSDVMVNATQLAKLYGKRPSDYLSLPSVNQLINAVTRKYGIADNQLVRSVKGGSDKTSQGTWMHRLIILDFCQWLDIDLKLWCTEKLDELLRYGMTATAPTLEEMIANPDLVINLAQKLKAEREEKQKLAELNAVQQKQLKEAAPKVVFSNAVAGSQSSCLIGELAKLISQNGIKMGQNKLFQWLRANGYLCKSGEAYNMPSQRYVEQGLFEIKEGVRSGKDGVLFTTKTPKVTGKGQIYFINKFLNN